MALRPAHHFEQELFRGLDAMKSCNHLRAQAATLVCI
jgi:hypothetical protein